MYSKSSGKGSRHSAISDSSSITAVSNIAVQVYEHMIGTSFRDTPHAQALRVIRFDFIHSAGFMCTLKSTPEITNEGLKISVEDWNLFKVIEKNKPDVLQAVKLLMGRQKGSVEGLDAEE